MTWIKVIYANISMLCVYSQKLHSEVLVSVKLGKSVYGEECGVFVHVCKCV